MATTLPKLQMIQAAFGDCMLLDISAGSFKRSYWLVDGGPGNQSRGGTFKKTNNSLFATLNYLGIAQLQRLIITHNDKDHTNGTYALISTLMDGNISNPNPPDKNADHVNYLKFVCWQYGYTTLNSDSSPKKFPIDHIWFNDLEVLRADITGARSADGTGWMTTLLKQFQKKYPNISLPAINDDWNGPILIGPQKQLDNITQIVGPTEAQLEALVDKKSAKLAAKPHTSWEQTAAMYLQDKTDNKKAYPSSVYTWGTNLETDTNELGDKSQTNMSSIMFEFENSGAKILMTGDGNGDTLYAAYRDQGDIQVFDIIKMPHHGSCHNNNIMRNQDGTVITASGKSILIAVQRFFSKFQASKYVISSDTLNQTPNPDLECITGMAMAFSSEPQHPVRAVYYTNGMTYKSWRAFYYAPLRQNETVAQRQNQKIALRVLRGGDGVDYGSVLPTVSEKPEDLFYAYFVECNWISLQNDKDWYKYFVERLGGYFQEQLDDAKSKGFLTDNDAKKEYILGLLLKLPDTKPKKGGKRTNASLQTTQSAKRIRREDRILGKNPDAMDADTADPGTVDPNAMVPSDDMVTTHPTTVDHARVLLKTAVLAAVPTIQPLGPLTFHDVIIANLISEGDLAAQMADDMSLPPVVTSVVEDGITPNWVDLPTFIDLIEKSNNLFVPTKYLPRLDPSFIPMLRWWFLSEDGKTAQPNILASMLLNSFLDENTVSELFVSLPLNENGAAAFATDPLEAFAAGNTPTTAAAMMSLTLNNFRAKIVAPTASEYTTGRKLEVITFYFELNLPPAGMYSTSDADIWTWTLPFSNGLWTGGNVLFQHQAGSSLKVKMMWPFYQDAITFCQFAGDLKISRASPVSLPVLGTMYSARGQPTSYDIQFTGNNGVIPALDLLTVFSPTTDLATAMLTELATAVQIPGLDLTSILKNDLVLRDAGLIFRQHAKGLQSVAIEDLYGTISTGDVLRLAKDLLPFPTGLQIPDTLPDLTVTMANVVGSANHKYTFAFSQQVAGLGTIAFQVGIGPDGQTQFDIFAIVQQETSVKDMLTKLSSDILLPEFEAARLFTDSLANLFVPYVHLNFAPKIPYQPGSGYSLAQLTLAVRLDNVAIPSDNPFINIEGLSVEIIYGGAADGIPSDISVFGYAVVTVGGYDADCTFQVDHTADEIQTFLDNEFDPTAASAPSDSTGGFQGQIMLTISFPNEAPTVGAMIDGLLGEAADALGLNSLTKNIPTELLSILDSNVFEAVEFQIQNDATTGNKWQIVYFHVQAKLEGLDDILSLLPGVSFDIPVLDVYISYPSDPVKKSYQVTLGSIISLQGGVCNISANFNSPPTGYESQPSECIGVSMNTDYSHPGLPLGKLVTTYIEVALDALDVNVQSRVPQELQDVVNSITIDEAMITFLKVGTSGWKTKFVECQISSDHAPWSPFSNFQVSQASLHFSHDFGIAALAADVTPATTQIQFNATLDIKTLTITITFTYDSASSGWSISFDADQTLDLVQVIENGIDDLGFQIPDSISSEINHILVIDTDSFYIAYSPGKGTAPESLVFSNDGQITLFGIGVSNISVFCNRPSTGGKWSYTVSLALPNPCTPLAAFSGPVFSFLSGIVIRDGQFAFFSNTPAPQVISPNVQLPNNLNSSKVVLSGKIFLGGNPFMQLISSIVQLDEIDICILPGALTISIPAASLGLNIMNVFKVKSFSFDIFVGGFGLGAMVELDADWLSATPITASFTLIIMDDGAFGAQIQIANITNPFGIPGIALQNANFSLVWLAEAMEPQSMSAGAALAVTQPGADPISGSFSLSMDEINPNSDYYKMHIENLTLVNLVNTLTHGTCPKIFSEINTGFNLLDINLQPTALTFTFDADFYIFAIEGKVHAAVQITTGISFGANLDLVNIIDLVRINAYKDATKGPFVYLDSTIKDIASGDLGPPKWMGVTSADDPNLKGSVFAMSGTMAYLDLDLDFYGVINTRGLQLIATVGTGLTVPDVDFSLSLSFDIIINSSSISAGTEFDFHFTLDLPDIDFAGVSLPSYDGTVVSLDGALSLTVSYSEADWQDDNAEFTATIKTNVLGLSLDEKMDIDKSIRSISQLPDSIEKFVKDQVVSYLKDKLLGPILQTAEEAKEMANEAIAEVADFFNMVGADIIAVLTDLGHEMEYIADALYNTLGYSIDEVAGALFDFGCDVNKISNIIGDVFNAAPQEVLSALTSAGVTIEHAVDAVFDEAGAELSKDFNLVGNSVAGFALDASSTIEHFLTGDMNSFVDSSVSDAGQFFDGVGSDVANFFSGGDCEIM